MREGVAHFEYVRLLCEVVVIGLSLFVVAILAYLLRLRGYTAKSTHGSLRTPAHAPIGGLVPYMVCCSADAFDYVSQLDKYVFGLAATAIKTRDLSALVRRSTGESPMPRETLLSNVVC
jgi:hypothetical protein